MYILSIHICIHILDRPVHTCAYTCAFALISPPRRHRGWLHGPYLRPAPPTTKINLRISCQFVCRHSVFPNSFPKSFPT